VRIGIVRCFKRGPGGTKNITASATC